MCFYERQGETEKNSVNVATIEREKVNTDPNLANVDLEKDND
jgi:hypothetical protein